LTVKPFLFKDEFDKSIKTISKSERKIIELKNFALSLIIRDRIVLKFSSLASRIRKEYNYKFDNKLLHYALSELEYEGKICILKAFKGKPKGRGRKYVYVYPTEENLRNIIILFPELMSELKIKLYDDGKSNPKCPLCKKNVNPVRTPEGEYVCLNDGYVFSQS
jgi:hypothetical protein